jgi:hypothetical protein
MAQHREVERPARGAREALLAKWRAREAHYAAWGEEWRRRQPYSARIARLAAGEPVEVACWELPAVFWPRGAGPSDRVRVDADGAVTLARR